MKRKPRGRSAATPTHTRKSPTERWVAFQAVQAFEQRGVYVSKVLDELFERHQLPVPSRRLATELAAETVRRRGTFDAVLAAYLTRPLNEVEPELLGVLRLGCCQLMCLSHIPPHAAVHETVELCRPLHKQRAKGFINGILRSIEREIRSSAEDASESNAPLQESNADAAHWSTQCAPDRFPQLDLSGFDSRVRWVQFTRPVFSSPQRGWANHLSQALSLPVWLLEKWLASQSVEAAADAALWFSTPGRMTLRVNVLKTSRSDMLAMLQATNIAATSGVHADAIVLESRAPVASLPGFSDGLWSVQDQSAMAAIDLLNPQPGEAILDLCAAPGGKTTHLAERLGGSGRVMACDVEPGRLQTVEAGAQRLGISTIQTQLLDREGKTRPQGPFDAVLADVPCSNTGVLGKRPEARWRISPREFDELAPLQRRLLQTAMELAGNGRVVYSTCSIDENENEQVVGHVIAAQTDWELVKEIRHLPGQPGDGGYQALLRRR